MTLRELTDRMHAFVREKGWYEEGSAHPQTPENLAKSLVIEAAEVLEHFQWSGKPKDPEALGSELADVLLYLLQIADVSGIDLEEATLGTLERNRGRRWD